MARSTKCICGKVHSTRNFVGPCEVAVAHEATVREMAAAEKAAALDRVQAIVDSALGRKPVTARDLNAEERRMGGEGRNGNFDCA